MKKLVAIVLMAGVGLGLYGQALPKELNLSKKFEKYRESTMFPCTNFYIEGCAMHGHLYDIDGDGAPDVMEVSPVTGMNKEGYVLITPNPLFYCFDINNNGEFEEDEIYFDKEKDGLNGNEKRLVQEYKVNI